MTETGGRLETVAIADDAEAAHTRVVTPVGALDRERCTAFVLDVARAVDAAVTEHADALGIDLSLVDFIDTSGLRALIEGKRHAREAGLRFVLLNVPLPVLRVVEMAALSRFFGLPSVRSRRDRG